MPIFYQQQVDAHTRLGVWKIEETEAFFKGNVPHHREVTHPKKRLQHLAGRFLLQYIRPDFPYSLIEIADTRKPYLPGEQYHFSISHCGDYAAAIVSGDKRVGIDVEIPVEGILRIRDKFLSPPEQARFGTDDMELLTLLWSCKESIFKWYGSGEVDFRKHIILQKIDAIAQIISCSFQKTGSQHLIHFRKFDGLVLTWTTMDA
jgi:phosphopantetheinyl transferase